MLLIKTDYLTVDISRNDFDKTEKYWRIYLVFTIQCNGRMRRSELQLPVVKWDMNEWASSTSVDWWDLENFTLLYNHFQLLADLGYEVPQGTDLHVYVHKALQYILD